MILNKIISALALANELSLDEEFKEVAKPILIRSLYYAGNHEECVSKIVSNFYMQNNYDNYEVNNLFYSAFLKLSEISDDVYKLNYLKYSHYIETLYNDASFESNDYFKFIKIVIFKEFKAPATKLVRDAIKNDSAHSFNFALLNRIIAFLFTTGHYNSIHNLINYIRKIDKIVLPVNVLFHYRACGVLSNNRIFINHPKHEERSDNIVNFPKNGSREILDLISKYLAVFDKLGYTRRKIVFCYCLLNSYKDNDEYKNIAFRLSEILKKEIYLLFKDETLSEEGINCRGLILRKTEEIFLIKDKYLKEYEFRSTRLLTKIELNQTSVNWSYFSVQKQPNTQNTQYGFAIKVEPGFVIDGYHDSERIIATKELRKPQGAFFRIVASKKIRPQKLKDDIVFFYN